jgi:dephospho-CoA kinase
MKTGVNEEGTPLRIALTGGIASGKTVVASILRDLGLVVVEADEIAHEILRDPLVKRRIAEAFGARVLRNDGEVDRRVLAEIVFTDVAKLRLLESITHPLIRQKIKELEEAALAAGKTVVSVIPLLFEKGLERGYDRVWVTFAPKEVCQRRLQQRDMLTEEAARARMAVQMDPAVKASRADVIIDTDCALKDLRERVAKLVSAL